MTDRLYLDDSYLLEFESKVISVTREGEKFDVILEATAFYPEAGGQVSDSGDLDSHGVIEVLENEPGDIVHRLESWTAEPGQTVAGRVDRARRLENMRRHTGQHILSQAFMKVAEARTLSSHLGLDAATIEIPPDGIDDTKIESSERLANEIVMADLPIEIGYYSRAELEQLPVRRFTAREGQYRIIRIGDYDYTACGGTHCGRTGEVGAIKIIGSENIRGHIRLSFLTGEQAIEDYRQKDGVVREVAAKLSCHFSDLPDRFERMEEQNKILRQEITRLRRELLPAEIETAAAAAVEAGGIKIIGGTFPKRDDRELKELASGIVEKYRAVVVLGGDDRLFIAVSPGLKFEASGLTGEYMRRYEGRGGGSPTLAQVGRLNPEKIKDDIEDFMKWLKGELGA